MNSSTERQDLELKPGDTDSGGRVVSRVFDKTDTYIVYETVGGGLHCSDPNEAFKPTPEFTQLLESVGGLVASLPRTAKRVGASRAFAATLWFRGQHDQAIGSLRSTEDRLRRIMLRQARLIYLSGTVTSLAAVAGLTFMTSSRLSERSLSYFLVSMSGAAGALVSVVTRGGLPHADVLDDRWGTFAYGIVRSLISIIFAVQTYLLVLGGVLLPSLAGSTERLLVLAFVAGFSEKLVPEAVIHQAISGGAHAS